MGIPVSANTEITKTLRVDAQKELARPGAGELMASYGDSLTFGINTIGLAEGGIGLARAGPGLWAKLMTFLGRESGEAAAAVPPVRPGEFSVADWTGYPAGVPKPQGPFRLLGGEEYQAARKAADAANKALRKDIQYVGQFDIHEIQPVKFNGSPSSVDNKIILDRAVHRQQVTPWWAALQKALESVRVP